MVFSSAVFLYVFLPVVFLLNLILPAKMRNIFLLFASLLFYAWGEPVYVLLMLLSIIVNYFFAGVIIKLRNNGSNIEKIRALLILSILFNLLMLIIFKYTNFLFDNLSMIFHNSFNIPVIRLPIGISFFTFQAMSFVIDTYKKGSIEKISLINTALYISFFPQLIAGPIVKYHDIENQINQREVTLNKCYNGFQRFIIGLSKKILVANILGQVADGIFSMQTSNINILTAWAGAIAYTLQIYFDFSGYSDMAIGLAKLFGFNIKENFKYPFIATSLRDFWKRWHISLTGWFREYVYIPLGGNRKGAVRTYLNMILVFFLTGLWHGANWTFIVWGMIHGAFMLLEKADIINVKINKYNPLKNAYVLMVVTIAFTFFRSDSIGYAFSYIIKMFTGFGFDSANMNALMRLLDPLSFITFIAAIIASTPVIPYIKSRYPRQALYRTGYVVTLGLLVLCVLTLAAKSYNPFIYFRF